MSEEATQRGRGWHRWWAWGQAALLVMASVLVVLGVAFSPMGLSSWLVPTMEKELETWSGQLVVEGLEREGIRGLRLSGVAADASRGGIDGTVTIEEVNLGVSLWGTVSTRRPVVRSVDVKGMKWSVGRSEGEPSSTRGEAGKGEETRGGVDWEQRLDGWTSYLEEDATLKVGAWRGEVEGHELSGRGATMDRKGASLVLRDAVPIEVGSAMNWEVELVDGDVVIRPVGDWVADVGTQWPIGVELDSVVVGQRDVEDVMQGGGIDDVQVDIRGLMVSTSQAGGLQMHWTTSTVERVPSGFRWSSDEGELDTGSGVYGLRDTEIDYREAAEGMTVFTEVVDDDEGHLDMEARWHGPTGLVDITLWFHEYHWDGAMPWPFGDQTPTTGAVIDGSAEGTLDLINGLISLDVDAEVNDLGLVMPWVLEKPFSLDHLSVNWPMIIDAKGRSLSIAGGTVDPGTGQAPMRFNGRVVEAGEGSHAFYLAGRGETEDVSVLIGAMPPALMGIVGEAGLSGPMEMGVSMKGHTADPESLVMEVDLGGDVEVVDGDLWEVQGAKLIPKGDPGDTLVLRSSDRWQELDSLAEHVPAAILASEDAGFFDHPGIDWSGIRMAMVENIKEGGLVRGGSTITQQVAKNLFLTHDRTLSRKLQEAFLTWRVEEALSKEEILELYLNVVEWGPEVHGIEAAAAHYFETSSSAIGVVEAVMLGAILPNPIRFGGAITQGYLPSSRADKMGRVLENMRFLEALSWEAYGEAMEALESGQIGALSLEICADDETAPEGARPCSELEVEARRGQAVEYEADEVDAEGDGDWVPLTH